MVPLMSLWGPILLSAVIVFVASSIIHMMLGYHKNDWRKLANEDGVMEAMRPFSIPPGDYMMPCAGSAKEMKDPAFLEKLNKGPVLIMTVMPNGKFEMGGTLVKWFVFLVVVGIFVGYIAGRTLAPGATYLAVFRVAGAVAFTAYALGAWPDSIWYRRDWGTTLRNTFDALVYALLTAGAFGWLWPR